MDMGYIIIRLQGKNMKGSGKLEKDTEKEYIFTIMGTYMMDYGKMGIKVV